jgi:hypothetical protein
MKLELKANSRTNWTIDESQKGNDGNIMLGAVLRIADATELMAKNYLAMQTEIEYLKQCKKSLEKHVKDLGNKLKAEKSAKTRFKNKLQ